MRVCAHTLTAGICLGMLVGSMVPVAGTVAGMVAGGVTGLAGSPLVAWLLARRDPAACWRRILWPTAIWCAIGFAVGLGCLGAGAGEYFGVVILLTYGGAVVSFFGLAVSCRVTQPPVWPPPLEGRCKKCGYDLSGLVAAICPECGASHADPPASPPPAPAA